MRIDRSRWMKLSGVRGWTKISEEGQRAAVWIKAVKWACIGVLMATALVSSYVFPPYVSGFQTVVRFAT